MREEDKSQKQRVQESGPLPRRMDELDKNETERKLAEEELRRSEWAARRLAKEYAILAEIGKIVSSTLSIEEIYERFVKKAYELIPFDRLAINLNHPAEGTLVMAHVWGVDIEGRRVGDIIRLKGSLNEKMMLTREGFIIQPQTIGDLGQRFPSLITTFQAGLQSMMSVPLIFRGQVIGALHFRSRKLKAFTDPDLGLGERIAAQIAGAIANAQLFLECKRVEENLQTQAATLREQVELLDLAYNTLMIRDLKHRILYWSRAAEEKYGWTKDEALGKVAHTLLQTQFPKRLKEVEADLFHEGWWEGELGQTRRNGLRMTVASCWALRRDRNGQPLAILEMVNKITGRKGKEGVLRGGEAAAPRQAQEAEILSEIGRTLDSTPNLGEVYERFAEQVHKLISFDRMAIHLINQRKNTTTLAYVSGVEVPGRRAGDVYPLEGSVEEEIQHTWSALKIPAGGNDARAERLPIPLPNFQAGLRSMIAVPLIHKGRVIGVLHLQSAKPNVYSEPDLKLAENIGARISGAVASTQLFNERKQEEEALKESAEKYRLLLDHAPEAVFIIQDEMIQFSNPKTLAILGYSPEESQQIPLVNLLNMIHPDEREMVLGQHKKMLQGDGVSSPYSFRIINRAGEELWLQVNSARIEWEGYPAILNFAREVTPERRREAQFQQAQKMETIGMLAGGIAHDFNNLLMGILGRTSLMLQDMNPGDPGFEFLTEIEDLVKNGADLIKQLLGFARRGKYEVRPTDLNQLIQKSSQMFGRTRKEIKIYRQFQQDIWMVAVDREQIEQALLNLYINSWQAMPDGGELYIQTRNVTLGQYYIKPYEVKPGNYIKISVTDTGLGMDQATQKRIFEPFFTTKELGQGTGLGLASVYGVIKNHNGFINVYSEKGHGTTFNIYIPAYEKEAADGEKVEKDEGFRGTETILFVDDEEAVLDAGVEGLKQLGYKALRARNGQEAIEVYGRNKSEIDVVIIDLIMPGMRGGEVFERMREITPDLKCLLSSGYAIHDQAAKVLELGCCGFIQKPFEARDLSKKIREILDSE
jgi:two-component system cell cycle sensor histidine kinase/response regulator CckA